MGTRRLGKISILGAALALPISAMAQSCCPSGGNGANVQTLSALSTTATAADCCPSGGNGVAASGLGQQTPNTLDLSSSPAWHVYVFQLNGVRYFQVNDAGLHVRAAFAASNGVVLPLPVGAEVVTQVADVPPNQPSIYQDAFVTIIPIQLPDGTVEWVVQSKL